MIKKIILYFISFSVLFVSTFAIHSQIVKFLDLELRFPLLSIYCFYFIASFIICTGFLFFSKSPKWQYQLGFIYIFALVTKLLFFVAVFKKLMFKTEPFTKIESFNLLIPLFIFLFLEVYFVVKILNKK